MHNLVVEGAAFVKGDVHGDGVHGPAGPRAAGLRRRVVPADVLVDNEGGTAGDTIIPVVIWVVAESAVTEKNETSALKRGNEIPTQ